ncbi:gamma-glutamyl-gamma-aminobutyrate hydrolase family protein [Hydromonas duriensis]|uniref:gamma-glutamyl-gamma-aminobutyrate hydrolase n=1 Tax=Hydromonas duriensis TaxID=1527608 RepID=A0A4R6Y666_9BURK|nr:gamma-glutamyl-gamma-aminobutyrate hydrolase family protein [Hydromonas duriensis]TDR30816.1 gamma-glutamyl-gamma-aminobutyrate hydrolase [Hydromonas duriensis]
MINNNTETTVQTTRKPIVLVPTGAKEYGGHWYQLMGKKYLDPLVHIADCAPVMLPTAYGEDRIEQYLDMADAIFLSGASTNIDPTLYGQEWLTQDQAQDKGRDNFNIALIRAGLKRGLPFLGICRGFQELNVAFGGDLYQKVHETPGMQDHREKDSEAPLTEQYGPNHSIKLVPDTWLQKILGVNDMMVNSLHGQGVKTLGRGIVALAHAEDGLVEAAYCPEFSQFTLGVQWHPEWLATENPLSVKLFKAFGQAARDYSGQR